MRTKGSGKLTCDGVTGCDEVIRPMPVEQFNFGAGLDGSKFYGVRCCTFASKEAAATLQ